MFNPHGLLVADRYIAFDHNFARSTISVTCFCVVLTPVKVHKCISEGISAVVHCGAVQCRFVMEQ